MTGIGSIVARPVDSWIYDRAEAIGGVSSFLYGAGGVGGTVNYVTKTAERTPITEGRLRLGSHRLGEASVGLNRRIAGEGARHGDHHLRLDVNHSPPPPPTGAAPAPEDPGSSRRSACHCASWAGKRDRRRRH